MKKGRIVFWGGAGLVALLNIAAWNSTAFADWYIANIFPIWVGTYGRFTGFFPFSVGEWLIAAGLVLTGMAAVLVILWTVWGLGILCRHVWKTWGVGACLGRVWKAWGVGACLGRVRKAWGVGACLGRVRKAWGVGACLGRVWEAWGVGARLGRVRKAWGVGARLGRVRKEAGPGGCLGCETASSLDNCGENDACPQRDRESRGGGQKSRAVWTGGRFGRFTRGFYRFYAWTLLAVCLVMTLNCFILYHASTFAEQYFVQRNTQYTLVDLIAVYNMAASECNRLALEMERDERGMVVYSGSRGAEGTLLDMADKAREQMERLGETYPQLKGYYPRPKAMFFSDFMCQQYMQGYYFPFSMEANYNDVMHILNIPSTMCHELAHLRGYIYEDEANFIGYLACVESDDPFFQYAGYLSVLTYLNNDLYYAWRDSRKAYQEAVKELPPVAVSEQVWEDNVFVTQEEWDRINGKALIDTEVVDKAADVFIDVNLKVNGISDGKVSYSRVVKLLLQYYIP